MSRFISFAFLLLIIASCSDKEQPVTKEEAMNMAHVIDSAINNKKSAYFNSLLNEKAFAAKVAKTSGLSLSAELKKEVKAALTQSDLGDKVIMGMGSSGTYELVKQYEKDKIQHLIFRLYSDDGLNYHDFELTKRDGKVAIGDLYIYLSGEDFSKTMSDLFTSFAAKNKKDADKKMAEALKIKKMRELIERNESESALRYYNELSSDLKNQKSVRLMHIMLCSQLDSDTYMKAIDDYQALYPNEPNMHLMMIDNYILRKEYGKALESINNIDNLINADPFLDYMRALMYNMMEKPAEARTHLEKLYQNMPGFDDGAVELIANYIDAGDDAKARQLIKEYESNKKYDQSLLDNYLNMKSYNRAE